jgi:hypothetical protein
MSIIGLINEYDRRQQACIASLEKQLEVEREKVNHLTDLLMTATAANERKQLALILTGHFDKKPDKERPTDTVCGCYCHMSRSTENSCIDCNCAHVGHGG